MRQIRSSGSAKAISLDRDEVIQRLRKAALEALELFPDLSEVWFIGSVATGTATGTSDVDLVLRLANVPTDPLEELEPYFYHFSRQLDIGVDIFVAGPRPDPQLERALARSVLLASLEI